MGRDWSIVNLGDLRVKDCQHGVKVKVLVPQQPTIFQREEDYDKLNGEEESKKHLEAEQQAILDMIAAEKALSITSRTQ